MFTLRKFVLLGIILFNCTMAQAAFDTLLLGSFLREDGKIGSVMSTTFSRQVYVTGLGWGNMISEVTEPGVTTIVAKNFQYGSNRTKEYKIVVDNKLVKVTAKDFDYEWSIVSEAGKKMSGPTKIIEKATRVKGRGAVALVGAALAIVAGASEASQVESQNAAGLSDNTNPKADFTSKNWARQADESAK